MLGLFVHWDQFARRLMGVRPVSPGSMLGYALRRYPHRELRTPDGEVLLRRGDLVIELHIDSRLIAAQTSGASAHQRVLALRRDMLKGMRNLAALVRTDPRFAEVRGLWGLTLLYGPMSHYGFAVVDLAPGLWQWLSTRYMRLLLAAYHPDGEERLAGREEKQVAKEIFLGREALLHRFGREQGRSAE